MRVFLFLGIFFLFLSCQQDVESTSATISPFTLDYIHKPVIQEKLYSADLLKWEGDYLKALDAYQKIDIAGLTVSEQLYIKNQQIYVLLKIHEIGLAKPILEELENEITSLKLERGLHADYLFNKAIYLKETYAIEASLKLLKTAKPLYLSIYSENHLRYAQCLNEIGMIYRFFTVNTDSCFYYTQEAFERATIESENKNLKAPFYFLKANADRFQRDYVNGLINANKAIEIATNNLFVDTILLARSYALKGHMIKKLKRLDEETKSINYIDLAQKQFDKSIELTNSYSKNNPILQEVFREKVIFCLYRDDENCFFENLEKLKNYIIKGKEEIACVDVNELLGYYHYLKKDYQQAITYYEIFLKENEHESLKAALLYYVYFVLIKSYQKTGQLILAQKIAEKNILLNTPFEKETFKKGYYKYKQVLSKKNNHFDIALLAQVHFEQYNEQINNLSSLRNAFEIQTFLDSIYFSKIGLVEEEAVLATIKDLGKEFYNTAFQTCYWLHEKTKEKEYLRWTLIFSERLKSYLLYKNAAPGKEEYTDKVPYDSLKKEHVLRTKINALKLKLLGEEIIMDNSYLELEALLKIQSQLNDYFSSQYPDYTSKKTYHKLPAWEFLVSKSEKKQATFIQFILTKTDVFSLLMNKDTALVVREIIDEGFEKTVRRYFNFLDKRSFDKKNKLQYIKDAHEIYLKLIFPLEKYLKTTKRLLVIPDGYLTNISFDALLTNNISGEIGFSGFPYLLNKYDIRYATSLQGYYKNQRTYSSMKKAKQILGYAFSGAPTTNFSKIDTFKRLNYSYKELESIRNLFPESDFYFKMGKNSKKRHFLKNYQKKDLIHFSVHSFSSDQNRLDNRIHFNREEQEYLYGYEIESLSLNKSIIVLSSCKSAYGKHDLGVGTFSLNRSFLLAGATKVLSTLWNTDEYATYVQMKYFYEFLAKDKEVGKALYEAKKVYLSEMDNFQCHPSLWANMLCYEG